LGYKHQKAGDHKEGQESHKNTLPERETQPGEGISGHRCGQQYDENTANADGEAVPQKGQDNPKSILIINKHPGIRKRPKMPIELFIVLKRSHECKEQGIKGQKKEKNQKNI
jgi:hypothetical protein